MIPGDGVGFVRDLLTRAMEARAWHGPALRELLAGVDGAVAAARPIAGAHSIRELVAHLAAWTDEVAARVEGRAPQEPDAGDWPAAVGDAETAWQAARAALLAAHQRLLAALDGLDPAALERPVGSAEEPALGTGQSLRGTLLGLAQHHAYHGGQIALLRRALADAAG